MPSSWVHTECSIQQVQHTPSTAYTEYSIHWVQHTPSTAYTKYSIHRVQHTPSTAYTEYSIHQVQHTPSTAYTEYSIHLGLPVVPSFSRFRVDPGICFSFRRTSLLIDCLQLVLHKSFQGKVTSSHSHGFELTNRWIESQHLARLPSTASRATTPKYSSYLAWS